MACAFGVSSARATLSSSHPDCVYVLPDLSYSFGYDYEALAGGAGALAGGVVTGDKAGNLRYFDVPRLAPLADTAAHSGEVTESLLLRLKFAGIDNL